MSDPQAETGAATDAEAPTEPWTGDVPPEVGRRLGGPTFSSGLTVPDFAACLQMGMRPVGLVQGFCVMQWSWYSGMGGGMYQPNGQVLSNYRCPHYYSGAEHRSWGNNTELDAMTRTWREGYFNALNRMIEEAQEAGAHGVIGVIDSTSQIIDNAIREFHVMGTAVVIEGHQGGDGIWTTFLAGQRLAKLIESGFMPVSIVATNEVVSMYGVCVTEILLRGSGDNMGQIRPGDEITQLADAHTQARNLARDRVRSQLGGDALHGARMQVYEREVGAGIVNVTCTLSGTRVRQFRQAEPLPLALPTVRLS